MTGSPMQKVLWKNPNVLGGCRTLNATSKVQMLTTWGLDFPDVTGLQNSVSARLNF
jgi:hypothetical protein